MNKKVGIVLAIGVAVAAIGVWIVLGSSSSRKAPAVENKTTQNSVASGTITYTDTGFSPETLSIKVGETVRVVNQSSATLEFSSADHPVHTENPELNMPAIEPGKDGMLKIAHTGTWGYHDHLHADHTGQIIVTD